MAVNETVRAKKEDPEEAINDNAFIKNDTHQSVRFHVYDRNNNSEWFQWLATQVYHTDVLPGETALVHGPRMRSYNYNDDMKVWIKGHKLYFNIKLKTQYIWDGTTMSECNGNTLIKATSTSRSCVTCNPKILSVIVYAMVIAVTVFATGFMVIGIVYL